MALHQDEGEDVAVESEEFGNNLVRCDHFTGGSELDCPLRLRYIKRHFPEDYKELEILREKVVGRLVGEIKRQAFQHTRKYASDVYLCRTEQQRARMLERLSRFSISYPGKVLIWVDEGDHIHVVHDCPMSNGQCRCYFKRSEDFRRDLRAPIRRYKFISEMDELDWTNVFLYFVMQKRESNSQVWIGGRLQRLPGSDESLRWQDMQRKSREILARQDQGDGRDIRGEESDSEYDRQSVSSATQVTRQKRSYDDSSGRAPQLPKKRTKFERISAAVHTLLNKYFCLPSNHIRDILVDDINQSYLFDPMNEKAYMAACELFQKKFISLKLRDLQDIYEHASPTFYANSTNPNDYYHDRETSLKFVDELIKFQIGDDEDNIRHFLTNIREWFNLKGWENNTKINAICIIGPPNSGKNYFWDMFCAIAYNVGHIGRVNNKTNQFALQECYGRRLVVGNEVSMEDGAKEDFKKLCEGTAFNIRVKYQGDKIFTRAPVLLISNFELDICYDRNFKDVRLYTMRWNTCNMLKESNKKPYPLCIFDLFNKYNVEI